MIKHPPTFKHSTGFTLLEVLIASTIMVILIGMTLVITNGSLQVLNRSSGKLNTNYEAKIALDYLSRDLESAIFRNDGYEWFRAQPEEVEDALNSYWLMFYSPAADRERVDESDNPISADICAVSYRLAFQDTIVENGENKLYGLYRYIHNPKETFKNAIGKNSDTQQEMQKRLPDPGDEPDQTLSAFWQIAKNDDATTGIENLLASNIVDIRFVFYYRNVNDPELPPLRRPDIDAESDSDKTIVIPFQYTIDNQPTETQPVYVDISMIILSDEGGRIMANLDKNPSLTAERIIQEHGSTFTRRIQFKNRPL